MKTQVFLWFPVELWTCVARSWILSNYVLDRKLTSLTAGSATVSGSFSTTSRWRGRIAFGLPQAARYIHSGMPHGDNREHRIQGLRNRYWIAPQNTGTILRQNIRIRYC